VPHEQSVRRLLTTRLAVDQARLVYPGDDLLDQLDEMLDRRTSLSREDMRTILDQLETRLVQLAAGG
jgi:hypothetical protein